MAPSTALGWNWSSASLSSVAAVLLSATALPCLLLHWSRLHCINGFLAIAHLLLGSGLGVASWLGAALFFITMAATVAASTSCELLVRWLQLLLLKLQLLIISAASLFGFFFFRRGFINSLSKLALPSTCNFLHGSSRWQLVTGLAAFNCNSWLLPLSCVRCLIGANSSCIISASAHAMVVSSGARLLLASLQALTVIVLPPASQPSLSSAAWQLLLICVCSSFSLPLCFICICCKLPSAHQCRHMVIACWNSAQLVTFWPSPTILPASRQHLVFTIILTSGAMVWFFTHLHAYMHVGY